jgi:phosphatidylglycerophosphate synthase
MLLNSEAYPPVAKAARYNPTLPMTGRRWRLPDAPLRTSFFVTNAIALVALAAVALMASTRLPLAGLYPLRAAAVFGGMALVAAGFVRDHHPFARYGPANQITTLRALLVALATSLIGEELLPAVSWTAAWLTLAVTLLDFVDGWLARRSRMASAFGARFDMEVDALLIMTLSALVWQFGKAGWWVLLSGLIRYLFVVAGWLSPWLNRPLPPSRRRQAICVVQIAGLNLAIVPAITAPGSAWLAGLALVALAGSFLADVVWLWRVRGVRL